MTTKLISREPTEEMRIASFRAFYGGDKQTREELALGIFEAMFDAAPSLNPWVSSVAVKRPKQTGLYWVLVESGDNGECPRRGFFSAEKNNFENHMTHWWDESIMPIPRPEE